MNSFKFNSRIMTFYNVYKQFTRICEPVIISMNISFCFFFLIPFLIVIPIIHCHPFNYFLIFIVALINVENLFSSLKHFNADHLLFGERFSDIYKFKKNRIKWTHRRFIVNIHKYICLCD